MVRLIVQFIENTIAERVRVSLQDEQDGGNDCAVVPYQVTFAVVFVNLLHTPHTRDHFISGDIFARSFASGMLRLMLTEGECRLRNTEKVQ